MIRFKVDESKSNFLDRKAVIDAVGKGTAKVMMASGGLIRKIARNSMRPAPKTKIKKIHDLRAKLAKGVRRAEVRRIRAEVRRLQKEASSPPGQPPRTVKGQLKEFLFFAFDPKANSVVIGPSKINKPGEVPSILESGGRETITRTIRVKGKKTKAKRTVTIKPHPYMGPALDKSKDKLGPLWANAVKP